MSTSLARTIGHQGFDPCQPLEIMDSWFQDWLGGLCDEQNITKHMATQLELLGVQNAAVHDASSQSLKPQDLKP